MRTTITDYKGEEHRLSEEIYEILNDTRSPSYQAGTLVQLISNDLDGNQKLGFHYNRDYVTVCSIHAQVAGFVGVLRTNLRQVS